MITTIIAALLVGRVVVGVVNKALLFEKVAAASFSRIIDLLLISVLLERVVLNVDLAALVDVRLLQIVLDHGHEPHELAALDLLRVEVVGFSYVEVRDDIVGRLREQHVAIQLDIVIELLITALLEVIHDRNLRRVVLDHELRWY